MDKPRIIVTGANCQLGKEIQALSLKYPAFDFVFLSRIDLPINDPEKIHQVFQNTQASFCIDCAAYTAVTKLKKKRKLRF